MAKKKSTISKRQNHSWDQKLLKTLSEASGIDFKTIQWRVKDLEKMCVSLSVSAQGDEKTTSIVYRRCEQIIQLCKDRNFFVEIPIGELRQLISEHIGGDPRTLTLYLSRLQYFGFMKRLNPQIMQICPKEVDQKAVRQQQDTLDNQILKQWGIKNHR